MYKCIQGAVYFTLVYTFVNPPVLSIAHPFWSFQLANTVLADFSENIQNLRKRPCLKAKTDILIKYNIISTYVVVFQLVLNNLSLGVGIIM